MQNHLAPADLPITESDDFIAEALQYASVPTLMMSMIHISGDASLLDGAIRPATALNGKHQSGLSDAEQAEMRARALAMIKKFRDDGCRLPPQPDTHTIHRMMEFLVGDTVPNEYVPMFMEELALDGEDSRDLSWDEIPDSEKKRLHVVVIGAGESGLLAAIRLQQAGVPYTVIEKNSGVGGTWFENSYPGCRVDIPNHFYCYSFEPNYDWTEYFAQQPELQRYFDSCAARYQVKPHIRFNTEVLRADYDESDNVWRVAVRTADGVDEILTANAVISAVGQLNRAKMPDIPGIDSFAGKSFHSSRWPRDFAIEGRRMAVIGTGASAFQLIPEVAKQAQKLCVFQRTPGWIWPNEIYHKQVDEQKKWLLKHVPFYGRWFRFFLFWPGSDGLLPNLFRDPQWTEPETSISQINKEIGEEFIENIYHHLGENSELAKKLIPDYPAFGKRLLQDDGTYVKALAQDNVEVVTDPIERIVPEGVVSGGRTYPVDTIVYATGFHSLKFLWPMAITGRGGITLEDYWQGGDDPRAYMGIAVPNFPNLFCMYGPGTNLGHGGSLIFNSECQTRYIMSCLQSLLKQRSGAMECRAQVSDAFYERYRKRASGLIWAHPRVTNWYTNSKGEVISNWPWRLLDYWQWTKQVNADDYIYTNRIYTTREEG